VGRVGSRGGNDGLGGGGSMARGTAGDDREGKRGDFAGRLLVSSFALASSSLLVGGRGGSLAWSSVGGSFLTDCASVPSDRAETEETYDFTDSVDGLRSTADCVDGRRGGREGEIGCVEVLVGSGGGNVPLRCGSGGDACGSASS